MRSCRLGFLCVAIFTLFATSTEASTWGGHNGTLTLSFSDSSTVRVLEDVRGRPEVGAIVDVYLFLGDIAPLTWRDERVQAVGGFELQLKIEGCQAKILTQQFPMPVVNVHPDKGHCLVGLSASLSLRDGPAQLVHWQVQLLGDLKNVKFSLDPTGLASCDVIDDCGSSGSYALWGGTLDANQLELIFSAGVQPAYINWTDGEPDLSIMRGTTDWDERGIFETY